MATNQFPPHNAALKQRLIHKRTSILGTRAIAGGILVGLAAIGTFFLATGLRQQPLDTLVVASHDLPVGHQIVANDVRVITVPKSSALQQHGFGATKSVIGTSLLGPLQTGEVVQRGTALAKRGPTDTVEVSFSIPSARALDGTLLSGETVDVLATSKSAAEPRATIAATNAKVLRAQASGGGIGRSSDVVVTLALPNRNDASTLTTAIDSGQLTLVRTTGSQSS